MSAETPRAFGFRKGRAFAEDIKAGTFQGASGEDFIERCLAGHRRAAAETDGDGWCRAYSTGFLRGYERDHAVAAEPAEERREAVAS